MGLIGFPVCSCMFRVVSCNLSLWLCVTLYICNLHRAQWIMLRYAWHLPNRGSRLLSICTSNFLLKLCRQNEISINLKGNISSYYNDVLNCLLSLKYFLTPLKEKCTLTMKTGIQTQTTCWENRSREKYQYSIAGLQSSMKWNNFLSFSHQDDCTVTSSAY